MEAKDTVISPEEIWKVQQGNCFWTEKQLTEHDDMVYKAGIREVVDWIRVNMPDDWGSIMEWSRWKDKLKEWGMVEASPPCGETAGRPKPTV